MGPYYAMFPLSLADTVINEYTHGAQPILDPFAGRASSIFAGAVNGRQSLGVEINPVGWVYGKTKLGAAPAVHVQQRVSQIAELAKEMPLPPTPGFEEFFRLCFTEQTLRFLAAARQHLDWRGNTVDRTLMALILVDLHGNKSRSFSNQMRQSKAMSPDYSINWWKKNNSSPPQIDPVTFLKKKISWRYAKGVAQTATSDIILGDSSEVLSYVEAERRAHNQPAFRLLFTSPPYFNVTDYHRDQWLRLWMLGQEPSIHRLKDKHKAAFSSLPSYKDLLEAVFLHSAEMMHAKGYVYVRTHAEEPTFELTRAALHSAFPRWRERIVDQPYTRQTQTALFGDSTKKLGEKDIILAGPEALFP